MIGGTGFLGPALVEAAIATGHDVTLFNRGRTDPDLFPGVERLRGERPHDVRALAGRRWDAAIDVPGTLPRQVRASAAQLAGMVKHYTLVSTISVYADLSRPVDEDSPLATLADETAADRDRWSDDLGPHYGALKVISERIVQELFHDRFLVVRPGLIVGPRDPTGRFTYWPHRIARGGDVLAPGDPARRVQFIDARDLGAWIVRLAEERVSGTYNATGPEPPVTMEELLDACRDATGSGASFVWVDDGFLLAEGVGEWMELPLWAPSAPGIFSADVSRALAAGLTFRPLAETVRAALEEAALVPGIGLAREREESLLAKWRVRA